MGPPADRDAAIAVLRRCGANSASTTSTPATTTARTSLNELIREALHPYPDGPGDRDQGRRTAHARGRVAGRRSRPRSCARPSTTTSTTSVSTSCDVVNLRHPRVARAGRAVARPSRSRPLASPCSRRGSVRYLGVSNVTTQMLAEAQSIGRVVVACRTTYILVHRERRPADRRRRRGRASPTYRSSRWAASRRRRRSRPDAIMERSCWPAGPAGSTTPHRGSGAAALSRCPASRRRQPAAAHAPVRRSQIAAPGRGEPGVRVPDILGCSPSRTLGVDSFATHHVPLGGTDAYANFREKK